MAIRFPIRMALGAVMALAATAASARQPAAPPSQAAQTVAAAKDAAASANPELVGQLSQELSVTPTQAEGAAGAVFSLAKKRLKPEEFGKVAAAVPGIEGLLKAAPLPDPKSAALDLASQGGGVAGLGSSLGKLGLKPEMALKIVPAISGYLKGKGAAEASQLVGGLLK
jgi:Protein of unknown function VcgC/VcgE (DUF2780)